MEALSCDELNFSTSAWGSNQVSINDESAFLQRYQSATKCINKKSNLMKRQYELANFWGMFGFNLDKAEDLQQQVVEYYHNSIKYNKKRYIFSLYSMAEIYFKQGEFINSSANLKALQELLEDNSDIRKELIYDIQTLELLLQIALKGIVKETQISYQIEQDLSLVYEDVRNIRRDWPLGEELQSSLNERRAMTRLIRWYTHNLAFNHPHPKYQRLDYIEKFINFIKEEKYIDDLFIEFALIKISHLKTDYCDSSLAQFVIYRSKNKLIETKKNQINALSVIAMCSKKSEQNESIERYATLLHQWLADMPIGFSPEVYFDVVFHLENLIENYDWPSNNNAVRHLVKLFQLRQLTSPTVSKASLNKSNIKNIKAQILFVKRQDLINQQYKLLISNRVNTETSNELAFQIRSIDEIFRKEFPKLARYAINDLISLDTLKDNLANNEEIILAFQTNSKLFNITITNNDTDFSLVNIKKNKLTELLSLLWNQVKKNDSETKSTAIEFSSYVRAIKAIEPSTNKIFFVADQNFSAFPTALLYDITKNKWLIETSNIERHLDLSTLTKKMMTPTYSTRLALADPTYNNLNKLIFGSAPISLEQRMLDYKASMAKKGTQKSRSGRNFIGLARLSKLSETREEANALLLGSSKKSKTLFDIEANKQKLVNELTQPWSLISLSTHTIFPDEENQLNYPALALTPIDESKSNNGIFSAKDIGNLEIKNSWVILAACETAKTIGKRNYLGSLVDSFLMAGARSVLASHWKIDSKQTVLFFKTVAENITISKSDSEIIWLARKQLIKDNYSPTVWSAFDIYL